MISLGAGETTPIFSASETTMVNITAGDDDIFVACGLVPDDAIGETITAGTYRYYFIPINHKIKVLLGSCQVSY
jgi:hypothetical protein